MGKKKFLATAGVRTTLSGSVVARPLFMNVPRLRARKVCSVIQKFRLYDIKGIHSELIDEGYYQQTLL